MKEQKSLKERAWDILTKKLKTECEGNKSMDRNIVKKMKWALQEAKNNLNQLEDM